MPKNMPETTRIEYSNEENTRSYSEKIADLRRNDKNINDNVKLRDQYFKIIEDTGYSKNRNEEYLDIQVPFSALENRKLEENMDPEDRAIYRQERRDDPTIDDVSEAEELANYQYHENIKPLLPVLCDTGRMFFYPPFSGMTITKARTATICPGLDLIKESVSGKPCFSTVCRRRRSLRPLSVLPIYRQK